MLSRAHHEGTVSRPAPPGFNADDIADIDRCYLLAPENQPDQTRVVPPASGGHRSGVTCRDDHPSGVHPEHDEFETADGCVRSQVFDAVCGGRPYKSGWLVHAP